MNLTTGVAVLLSAFFDRLMSVKVWLAVLCASLFPIWCQAQTTVFPQWTGRYSGPDNNAAPSALAADSQGNTYVTGSVIMGSAFSPNEEMITAKYDPDGHELWQAFVSSPVGQAHGTDIAVDAVGNVYVTGVLALQGTFNLPAATEFVTAKYNTNGVRQWIDTLAPPTGGNNVPYKLLVSPQDDVFVTGTACLANNFSCQVAVIKYDSTGRHQWTRQYPPPVSRVFTSAAGIGMDTQGNTYVANNSTHTGPMIYKFDVNGNLLKSFPTGEGSSIEAFHVDSQGNSYAGGCNPAAVIAKTNSQGASEWVHNLTPFSCLAGIQTDSTGNVFISQTLRGTSGAFSDISVLKLNASGVQQWETQSNGGQGGRNTDLAGPLVLNSAGEVYVTGSDNNGAETNFITIKYDPTGHQNWMQLYAKAGQSNLAREIAIGGDGGLFVLGTSAFSSISSNSAWLLVDYVQDAAKLAPSGLLFGNQIINSQSTAQSVRLTNTTSAALDITGITINGDFHETNNCPSVLAAELSCTINVTFTPTILGSRTGTLTVTDIWEGSPRKVTLTGTGVS